MTWPLSRDVKEYECREELILQAWDKELRDEFIAKRRRTEVGGDLHDEYIKRMNIINSFIPESMCDQKAKECCAQILAFNKYPQFVADLVVGPALKYAFYALIVKLTFLIVYPFVAMIFSSCVSDSFAQVPGWLYVPYAPFLVIGLVLEFYCLWYTLPAQICLVQQPRMLSYKLTRMQFFGLVIPLSVAAHTDTLTLSLWLGKMWKTIQCPHAADHIEQFWRIFWKDSIWGQRNVPSFFHCTSFIYVVAILRVAVGVCWSIPLHREWKRTVIESNRVIEKTCSHPFKDDSFFMIQDRRKGKEFGGFKTYSTVLNRKTHHCESLMALAECTNMFSVTFNDWLYRLKTINTGNMKSGQIATEMKRQIWSMLVLSLTSIANVQIKSSALELDLQLHKENGGGFSFLVTATLVFSVSSFLYDFGNRVLKIFQLYNEVRNAEWHEPHDAKAENYNWRVKYIGCHGLLVLWIAMALVSLYFVVVYGLVKLVMVNICHGGWNIPFHLTGDGCVHIS